ncbi:MAG: hypothetical protein AB7U29_04775 [Desulfobulbus sp.]
MTKKQYKYEGEEWVGCKGDYAIIAIPFTYFLLRSFYPDSERWAERIHIALNEEYHFKGEQVSVGNPICGCKEYARTENTALRRWFPGRKKKVRVCQNCIMKLLIENTLHIESDY